MKSGRAPGAYESRVRLSCDTSCVRAYCYHSDIMEAIGSKDRVVEQGRPMQQTEERARLLEGVWICWSCGRR